MKSFDDIKLKYLNLGVTQDNIDYAVEAVIEGTKREHIHETLTSDYRGVSDSQSMEMLEELFRANGGEFKKENRYGYLYGIVLSVVGLVGSCLLITMIVWGEFRVKYFALFFVIAVFGLLKGPILIVKSFRGKYRDNDDPFIE